jgi:hypothetical protein
MNVPEQRWSLIAIRPLPSGSDRPACRAALPSHRVRSGHLLAVELAVGDPDPGAAFSVLELDHDERLGRLCPHPSPAPRELEAARRVDRSELADQRHRGAAARGLHHDLVLTSGPQVERGAWNRELPGAEPLFEHPRVGPCLEHRITRPGNHVFDVDVVAHASPCSKWLIGPSRRSPQKRSYCASQP